MSKNGGKGDEIAKKGNKNSNYCYFEVCIGPGPAERDDDFWMCVRGIREPTAKEAERFYASDVARHGGRVLGIYPIDRKTAMSCYDFEREDSWPVFGL